MTGSEFLMAHMAEFAERDPEQVLLIYTDGKGGIATVGNVPYVVGIGMAESAKHRLIKEHLRDEPKQT
jgi:hypothetical protein